MAKLELSAYSCMPPCNSQIAILKLTSDLSDNFIISLIFLSIIAAYLSKNVFFEVNLDFWPMVTKLSSFYTLEWMEVCAKFHKAFWNIAFKWMRHTDGQTSDNSSCSPNIFFQITDIHTYIHTYIHLEKWARWLDSEQTGAGWSEHR